VTPEHGVGRRLSRSVDGRPPARVRILHLGLGNFFRAHAAWYTEHAPDANDWGIAAFTGRSPATALALAEQDALYTLLVRAPDGPRPEVVSSLSAVHAADDLDALRGYFARPEVAAVTLTVTEAGYRRDHTGGLDVSAADVVSDIGALRSDALGGVTTTTPGRLVSGFLARRAAGVGPLAVIPNDNVPDNGAMVSQVVADLASEVDPTLSGWIDDHVGWVTTMVDRITPRTTEEDRALVLARTGVDDPQTVPTEPFSEWVLSGPFPGGRPAWDLAGARVVDDVRPFEQRKLWLLNGSHSLMAYAGSLLGHRTVADAIADPVVRAWVEQWWDAAGSHVPLQAQDVSDYRKALTERFSNVAIQHLLAQIASDGSQKMPIRAVPVIEAGLAEGRVDPGATRLVAAWIVHLRGRGVPVVDARAEELAALAGGTLAQGVGRTLEWLGVSSTEVGTTVEAQANELERLSRHTG
jgi:fructuronate reductase